MAFTARTTTIRATTTRAVRAYRGTTTETAAQGNEGAKSVLLRTPLPRFGEYRRDLYEMRAMWIAEEHLHPRRQRRRHCDAADKRFREFMKHAQGMVDNLIEYAPQ